MLSELSVIAKRAKLHSNASKVWFHVWSRGQIYLTVLNHPVMQHGWSTSLYVQCVCVCMFLFTFCIHPCACMIIFCMCVYICEFTSLEWCLYINGICVEHLYVCMCMYVYTMYEFVVGIDRCSISCLHVYLTCTIQYMCECFGMCLCEFKLTMQSYMCLYIFVSECDVIHACICTPVCFTPHLYPHPTPCAHLSVWSSVPEYTDMLSEYGSASQRLSGMASLISPN